jgi:nitrogen fixation/metabolism regulation signal transduction histidine kinase
MFVVLITMLSLLVAGIGVAGIIVTHRVAGPVHKMKRLLGYVGDGHFRLTEKLRKGDELQHFFDAFERMVESLRERQLVEIGKLDQAINGLQGKVPDQQLAALRSLRQEMMDALETSPAPSVLPA